MCILVTLAHDGARMAALTGCPQMLVQPFRSSGACGRVARLLNQLVIGPKILATEWTLDVSGCHGALVLCPDLHAFNMDIVTAAVSVTYPCIFMSF